MKCEELRDSYEPFALGVAEEPERGEIRAHLNRGCDVCTPAVKQALELAAIMISAAPRVSPPPGLRRRILASVAPNSRKFRWTPVWAAAAALCLAAAIYFVLEDRRLTAQTQILHQQLNRQRQELALLNQAFSILNGPETKEASFGSAQPMPPRGKVFLNASQGVLLIVSDLPPAPAGKLYEMWTIPRGGKPVAAGLFQSQSDGSALHVRPGFIDVWTTAAVAVTVENEAGADQPTSQPFIVAAFTAPK